MRSYKIRTRTMPPTTNAPKRVAVDTDEGSHIVAPWDHAYDAPEVHENAARMVAEMENKYETYTLQRINSDAIGYTFRVLVGEVPA